MRRVAYRLEWRAFLVRPEIASPRPEVAHQPRMASRSPGDYWRVARYHRLAHGVLTRLSLIRPRDDGSR